MCQDVEINGRTVAEISGTGSDDQGLAPQSIGARDLHGGTEDFHTQWVKMIGS